MTLLLCALLVGLGNQRLHFFLSIVHNYFFQSRSIPTHPNFFLYQKVVTRSYIWKNEWFYIYTHTQLTFTERCSIACPPKQPTTQSVHPFHPTHLCIFLCVARHVLVLLFYIDYVLGRTNKNATGLTWSRHIRQRCTPWGQGWWWGYSGRGWHW